MAYAAAQQAQNAPPPLPTALDKKWTADRTSGSIVNGCKFNWMSVNKEKAVSLVS
jgi:hypothetical protein